MNVTIYGNCLVINIEPNSTDTNVLLPDGYSYETLIINATSNAWGINNSNITSNSILQYPPVNEKSPCSIKVNITDTTKTSVIRLIIAKFGMIPDLHYFDTAFEPILVTGDDGKEYNVIPSDQFK